MAGVAGGPVARKGIITSQIALHLSGTQQRGAFGAQVEDIQDTLEMRRREWITATRWGRPPGAHLCFCDARMLQHEARWSVSELTPGGSAA